MIVGSLDTGGGDGGPAAQAHLSHAGGVARDHDGNLYVADTGNHRVRRVSPSGIITTFAGNGAPASTGDGGPATQASLHSPAGVAVDAGGNVYVAEYKGHRIRKIARDGTISTVAGTGHLGTSGDGGPALQAMLSNPWALAADSRGNLFVSDNDYYNLVTRIRRVSVDGKIDTVVGGGSSTVTDPDGLSGTSLNLQGSTIAVTTDGDLIVVVSGVIASLDAHGVLHDVSGPSTAANTSPAEGQAARQTWLNAGLVAPMTGGGVAVFVVVEHHGQLWRFGADGALHLLSGQAAWGYSAAASNDTVWSSLDDSVWASTSSGPPTLFAGKTPSNSPGDGGSASAAALQNITALAVDASGNLYVADSLANRIRRIGTDGKISTFAGNGQQGAAGDGGPATQAQLYQPSALAFDPSGNLYVSDGARKIRKIAKDGTITLFAGGTCPSFASDCNPDHLATKAALEPVALAVDTKGQVFILDKAPGVTAGDTIWRVDLDGKISFFGRVDRSIADGSRPVQMTIDSSGQIVMKPPEIWGLYRVPPSGESTTTNFPPYIHYPVSVGWGIQGEIYVGDMSGKVYRVGADQSLHTVWDTALNIDVVDFNNVLPMVVSSTGDLYIAEQVRNRIIKVANAAACAGVQRPLPLYTAYNAASSVSGTIAPGEIATFWGLGIGPAQPADRVIIGGTRFDTKAGNTRVLFDGIPAPMLYASEHQVNTVVPYELTGAAAARVSIEVNGVPSDEVVRNLTTAAPGIFTRDSSGKGQAACLNQDYSQNSANKPAAKGSVIMLYLTGEGQTDPAGTNGLIALNFNRLPKPLLPVTATIDGQPAEVQYAGAAPGMVAGLMQVNVKIPDGARSGSAIPVVVQVGTAKSPDGVTVAIQ